MATQAGPNLATTNAQLQSQSSALRKELGFSDLVLASILLVVIPDFFGTAVKAGSAHVVLWLLAILLFFIPQAFVVAHLNRLMPLEGGLYEWTRLAFNDFLGYLVAWNLWVYVVLYLGRPGGGELYQLRHQSLGDSRCGKPLARPGSLHIDHRISHVYRAHRLARRQMGHQCRQFSDGSCDCLPGVDANRAKLARLAAWLSSASFCGAAAEPFYAQCVQQDDLWSFVRLRIRRNLRGRIVQSGAPLEAGHSPDRAAHCPSLHSGNKRHSGLCPSRKCGPHRCNPAGAQQGFGRLQPGSNHRADRYRASLHQLSFDVCDQFHRQYPPSDGCRLGHLLPEWFSRLHAKYKTPVNSILFLGAITIATSVVVLAGVGDQEAFELLQIWGFTFYGVAYLALFAIPVLARRDRGIRTGWPLRLAAISGFLMTLLFVLLSAFPIIPVANQRAYSQRTVAVILGANLTGAILYKLGAKRGVKSPA